MTSNYFLKNLFIKLTIINYSLFITKLILYTLRYNIKI